MSTSSAGEAAVVRDLLGGWLGRPPKEVEPLPGGANSAAYRVVAEGGPEYFVKKYIPRRDDTRDRLSTEFRALSFIWENGLRCVPRPIHADGSAGIAVYEFVRGRKFNPGEVGREEVEVTSDFLAALHRLRREPGADGLPPASEACFSLRDHIGLLRARIKNLTGLSINDEAHREMLGYMKGELVPFSEKAVGFVERTARERGVDIEREISPGERTLSPSDLGFHNALRRDDGSIVFIDFEYFGWDDPAKMISDFYLQPAVPVPREFREGFFRRLQDCLGNGPELEKRLPLVYIILSLKWCLIMLNVFLRDGRQDETLGRLRMAQLEKARRKLGDAVREYGAKAFPLSLT